MNTFSERFVFLFGSAVLLACTTSACATDTTEEDDEYTPTSLTDPEADGEEAVGTTSEALSQCGAICGGIGGVACSPFGGWVGAFACGYAGSAICESACKHRTPGRISEERARRCLLAELPNGANVRHIGYRGTLLLFDVSNVHTRDGHTHSGHAAVKKTYAGPDRVVLSWRIGGDHVRPLSPADCR